GPAIEWLPHSRITEQDGYGSEVLVDDEAFVVLILKIVEKELYGQARKEVDGLYCDAQICTNGHVQQSDGTPFDRKAYCAKCGAGCIDACEHCKTSIRGRPMHSASDYSRPAFCHGCGRPYPWMADRLQTARELLRHDEKLTSADRIELFDLLQYVMSDPMAPLTPAKRKLIDIRLSNATQQVREFVLDLVA